MWYQFFLENAHFAINLFVALVFFAVFWLYWDAWRERKAFLGVVRLLGYLLLSLSFVFSAVTVESSILTTSLLGASTITILVAVTKIPGYILLITSLAAEPLEKRPNAMMVVPLGLLAVGSTYFTYPVLAAMVGFFYLRRATIGLEDHLKSLAYSFFLLSIAEFFGVARVFTQSANVGIYNLTAPFGVVWAVQQLLLVVVASLVGKWVFGYLLKQFQTQLFMVFTTAILLIFLVTTVAFTGLLVRNIENESLAQLSTDVKVLDYTLQSKKSELISDAQVLSQNQDVVKGIGDTNRTTLSDLTAAFLLTKNESTIVVTNDSGVVLARGEDRERAGDSLSDDPLVKRALLGETNASVVTHDGVVAPTIILEAATPVKDGGKLIGVVVTGSVVDNAYVDGLKKATGLEAMIYGDTIVSAGTLMTPDGQSRLTGMKETHAAIKTSVLINNQNYTGTTTIVNQPYYASYFPLTDVNNNPVGMLFVGRPQIGVLQTAGRSIELTFLVTVLLLVFSIFPAYFIAAYIANQL